MCRLSYNYMHCRSMAPDSSYDKVIFTGGAKHYAGIVVVRFRVIFSDTSRKGLNSSNKHGDICNLDHKFHI